MDSKPSEVLPFNEKVYDELPVTHSKDIEIVKRVGHGSFGNVYLCKRKKVIYKQMHTDTSEQKSLFIKEAKIMQKYTHTNIVQFDSLYQSDDENKIGFLMEYVHFDINHLNQKLEGSSLAELLKSLDQFCCKDYEHFQMVIAKDITKGLSYLHENKVVHRDLKPANVLISNQHYGNQAEMENYWKLKPVVAKIADFGESRSSVIQTFKPNEVTTSRVLRGTATFLAPEAYTDEKVKFGLAELEKIDTWALLMIFYVLINPDQRYPFQEEISKLRNEGMSDDIEIMKKIFINPSAPKHGKKYNIMRLEHWKTISDIIEAGTTCTSTRPSSKTILLELENESNAERSQFDKMSEGDEGDRLEKITPVKKKVLFNSSSFYNNPLTWLDWHKQNALPFMKNKCNEISHAGIPDETTLNLTLPVHEIDADGKEKLKNPKDAIQFMWIGHSTFLVQFNGVTVLADPVFLRRSSRQEQIAGYYRYRPPPCEIDDLPTIDAVIVSHNHNDHLEHAAVLKLNAKFKDVQWYVPEGTGSWFKGYNCVNIKEMTWWKEDVVKIKGTEVTFCCVPAQHWSQRVPTDAMKSLWCGWVIKSKHTFYYSGDTGYCPVFKTIGKEYGPMDLSAIPIGCYAPRHFMKAQYINPEEAVKVHIDVRSKYSVGIHWGTFDGLGSTEFYLEPKEHLGTNVESAKTEHDNFGEFITVEHGQITCIPTKSNEDEQLL